jgi:heme exporter protein A
MYDVPQLGERIDQLAGEMGLEPYFRQRVRSLSHGMQKRVSIARAVIHNPDLVLLDEPEAGLDQRATEMLAEMLNGLRREGRTIVMTTHNLERGLKMGDCVAILARGKLVFKEARLEVDAASFQETYLRYTGVPR